MPAYQSVPELDLSEKYHLKAVGCENAPNTLPIKPPNRNGKSSQRNGIRWRIKPPRC
jgi:hypothetical protein